MRRKGGVAKMLLPVKCSEKIFIGETSSKSAPKSFSSLREYTSTGRHKSTLLLQPTLAPKIFKNSLIVYENSSHKRHRTLVNYVQKLRPKYFSDSRILYGKAETFGCSVNTDSNTDEQKRFSTSLLFDIGKKLMFNMPNHEELRANDSVTEENNSKIRFENNSKLNDYDDIKASFTTTIEANIDSVENNSQLDHFNIVFSETGIESLFSHSADGVSKNKPTTSTNYVVITDDNKSLCRSAWKSERNEKNKNIMRNNNSIDYSYAGAD